MNKTPKIMLSFGQLCWHYSIVPFLLIVPILDVWDWLSHHVLQKYDGNSNPSEVLPLSLVFIALSVMFFFIQKRKLRFNEFEMHYTNDAFDKALKTTAEELKWKITERNKNYIRAYRNWNGSASWGELITIKRDNGRILINSICNPDAIFISVISYGWNRKNVRTFINNLSEQSRNVDMVSVEK